MAIFEKVLSKFPKDHLAMAFAYGSAVFKQVQNDKADKNMIDFVFVVDDSKEWHSKNIQMNKKHYSALRYLGPAQIAAIQEKFGAQIFYNSLVMCEGRLIKYGVISTKSLIRDLVDWETLYVSGRMHKPVKIIHKEDKPDLDFAIQTNYQHALHVALLLLWDDFSERELYEAITSISYAGDFRMKFGENKNKVQNIVKPNMEHFRKIYGPLLEEEEHVHWNKSSYSLQQDVGPVARYHHLNLLPKMVQLGIINQRNSDGKERDAEEVFHVYSHDYSCRDVLLQCINGIVHQSSWSQSLKGVITAGFIKSVKYSWSKIRKMAKS